jgi:hypothetical protein
MAGTQATDVLERLLDDEYVQEQLANAGAGLRDLYRRARRLPPEEAVQDRTVYSRLRQTAGGVTNAARRVAGTRKPEPQPRRRGRGVLMVVVIAAGAVVVWAARSSGRTRQGAEPSAPAAPEPGLGRRQ